MCVSQDAANVKKSEKLERIDSKLVYIFKSSSNGLKEVESFLKNRGWVVESGADFNSVLLFLKEKKPFFVMLSVNHQDKLTKTLPKVISQMFPLQQKLILFSEDDSEFGHQSLKDSGQKYTIPGPASGPSFDRLLLKIQKDERDKELRSKKIS